MMSDRFEKLAKVFIVSVVIFVAGIVPALMVRESRKPPAIHTSRFLVVIAQSNVVESSYVVVSNKVPVRLSEQMANDLHRYVAIRAGMTNASKLVNVVRLEEP